MKNLRVFLWIGVVVFGIGLLFSRVVFPEFIWATALTGVALLACLGTLIKQNREALKTRSVAYGANSLITTFLVVAIIGVVNFMGSRYPQTLDLTKNKIHTLSEQTKKIVTGLDAPVKAVFYGPMDMKEKSRPILENFKNLSPKFEVEYVDPNKEPTRAKQNGIRKAGTLQLLYGAKDVKIEDITEEKLTNALIKILKKKTQTVCTLTGHGEKSFTGTDAEGYDTIRKGMLSQSYEVKDLNLMQEAKIPEYCDGLILAGATKAFFPQEVKALSDYLENGGRAVVMLDLNLQGAEYAPELVDLLKKWNVNARVALIIDPLSKMLGVDAAVPILPTFSKDSPITKETTDNAFFPFTRPLEVIPGAPAGMNVQWLAQSSPKSWGETNIKGLAKGEASMDEGVDIKPPMNAAIQVEGKQKDSKATRNTRLVIFGSSSFGNNNFSRHGSNRDLLLNAISWIVEDESVISIRAKEDGPSRIELSQKQGAFLFLFTVIIIPVLVVIGGIVVWVIRKRL